jgi:hypothetical protein
MEIKITHPDTPSIPYLGPDHSSHFLYDESMEHKSKLTAILQEVLMKNNPSNHTNVYQIKIRENLDTAVTDWFGDLTLTPVENGGTLLKGAFSDQSALRGFLDQLWNLNFTVLSVDKIETELKEN